MTPERQRESQQEIEAQELFVRLLERDHSDSRQQLQELEQVLAEERLTVGDQPLPLTFSPIVLSSGTWSRVRSSLDRLQRILSRVEPILESPRWLDWLGIDPAEQEWIRLDHQLKAGSGICRVDGFLSESFGVGPGYQIVELNVDSPGGAAFLDRLSDRLEATPIWQEFSKKVPGATPRFGPELYRHLESCWTSFVSEHSDLQVERQKPRIAIVDWITVSTHREFELIAEGLKAVGFDAVVADPRELEFRGGRLRCFDGKVIDLVYRRVLVEDLLRDPSGSRALIDACRAGKVCLVNSFASKPLTVKSLLALVHDPVAEELILPGDLTFLRSLIPVTLRLNRESVSRLQREQERFVLKPADGWGAQGLYLGWRCTESEWKEHLKRCLAVGGYIAQARVPIPKRALPTWAGDRWQVFDYLFDLSPYSLGESTILPHSRLSPSEILNVKQGARISPVWVTSE